jgi:ATP adenylyltransferase
MEYIEGHGAEGGCIFCAPPGAGDDRARLILQRGRHAFVMLNRFPYSAGHLMVAPYAHVARLQGLEPSARADLMEHLAGASRVLEHGYGSEGLNLGANLGTAAGAGVADHLHFHLVPRWTGDTNFMTVVGETRVIPEHLERTYERLAPLFGELAPS